MIVHEPAYDTRITAPSRCDSCLAQVHHEAFTHHRSLAYSSQHPGAAHIADDARLATRQPSCALPVRAIPAARSNRASPTFRACVSSN